jgi:hypothetical protein
MSVIWFIDDIPSEAEEYQDLLQAADGALNIQTLSPLAQEADYADVLLHRDTSGFIIDHQLDKAGVPYDGAKLASYLRSFAGTLPVFLLTKYKASAEDAKGADDADWIIDKNTVNEHADIYAARISGMVTQFDRNRYGQKRELAALLERAARTTMSPIEQARIKELREELSFTATSLTGEASAIAEKDFEERREFIGRLDALIKRLEDI